MAVKSLLRSVLILLLATREYISSRTKYQADLVSHVVTQTLNNGHMTLPKMMQC